jgi:hypothetical protein
MKKIGQLVTILVYFLSPIGIVLLILITAPSGSPDIAQLPNAVLIITIWAIALPYWSR